MTILNPTPGELYDRLCILELKIARGTDLGAQVAHFEGERDEILKALSKHSIPYDVAARLAQIHSELWDLTDQQTRAESLGDREAYSLLIALRNFNRERYRLREEIDKALNAYSGKEKLL